MGLTEAEQVFAGVTETALNDLFRAFLTARPRYLHYGSPGFVAATTVAATVMPAIAFPGVPGGIDWSVELAIPRLDLHPQTESLPPELSLSSGQLSISIAARLCVACVARRDRNPDDQQGSDRPSDDKPVDEGEPSFDDRPPDGTDGTCCELKLYGVGHVERTFMPDAVRLVVDSMEIVDIEPNALESVLECLMVQIVRGVLAEIRLPLETWGTGTFSLTLTRGPEVEDDQLKSYGNV